MNAESLRETQQNGERSARKGRILYLTKNPELIRQQLEGTDLVGINQDELMPDISTDELIPNSVCLRFTGSEAEYLGTYALTGLRRGIIKPGEIKAGNFQIIVAGSAFAQGSSRIHAPLALKEAGIETVVADAQRIFRDNCNNLGMRVFSPNDYRTQLLLDGKYDPNQDVSDTDTSIASQIRTSGGLLGYFKAIEEGRSNPPKTETSKRPMTIAEKIFASKAINKDGGIGILGTKPGEECVLEPDVYYGYELQTPVVRTALHQEFGDNIPVIRPDKISLHNDHTALLTTPEALIQRGEQTNFGQSYGIKVYELTPDGAPAICHIQIVESIGLPGQLILGNDSHTSTDGVLNTLAIGKGAIDLAGAIAYDRMVAVVPQTIRINLMGKLPENVTIKDFMLWLGANSEFRNQPPGQVLEFGGKILDEIPLDEQIPLTNMAVELLGFTGITEPNKQIVKYLKEKRGLSEAEIRQMMISPDPDAEYSNVLNIDLSTVEQMVATPGNPKNGIPLSEIVKQRIKIQKAYAGSCTNGSIGDLEQIAFILNGRKVSEGVQFYISPNSISVLKEAKERGLLETFKNAGAIVLPVGCGACMDAGPGSTEENETAIFATNRNFPRRTGKGDTYLASPQVIAASAITGFICGPKSLDKLS